MADRTIFGPTLEPPHDGLSRLVESVRGLEGRSRATRYWWAVAALAGALVVCLVLVFVVGTIRQRGIDRAVRQALSATPQTHFENAAFMVLPRREPGVQILLVARLPRSTAGPETSGD